jgi:hypothetical protein
MHAKHAKAPSCGCCEEKRGKVWLRQNGMTDWLCLGQHSTSMLWMSPTGKGTIRVYAGGSLT